jgi:hypothetical protein
VIEVPPVGPEPDVDAALLACTRCRDAIAGKRVELAELRFLEGAVWSELEPARLAAIRIARTLDVQWATDALDGLWIDDDLAAKLDAR